jgi:UDP-2,3-diacylglucosamine pyrophosphatase LpxH
MSIKKRLTEVFESAMEIPFDDSSKFILFSDVHRADNSWADDFAQNNNLFFFALSQYYKEGFTYIEVGDGDEMWEVKNFADIREAHSNVFWLMRKFYGEGRFYMMWGNHDIERKNPKIVKKTLYRYFDQRTGKYEPLFDGIKVHEGLLLRHKDTKKKIFLVHGHQGGIMVETLWRLDRFLQRFFWKQLQLFGFRDPTLPSKNYKTRVKVEKEIIEWVKARSQMLIGGHIHYPIFPDEGEPPYFNCGSCVHPRSITGFEIQNGEITLIKWFVKSKEDGLLQIAREVIVGPKKL